jgi:GntR family transcriptional regulator/MocR family aminotransferase
MLDQGDLQEQMLSELIYEGEIHRLLKKNILVYKQRRDFLYQCLEENFKDAIRFKKTTGGLAIWLQFNKFPWFNFQNKRYAMICFCLKPYFIKTKTCAIRLGFGHLKRRNRNHSEKIETGL